MTEHKISLNRAEFRKTKNLGVVCSCGFSQMTVENEIGEIFYIVKGHRDETGHILTNRRTEL